MEAARLAERQPQHGLRGQLAAVFAHRLRRRDVAAIQSGCFPVLVLHGRQDIIALPRYGEKLAARLQAPFVALEGGHFVMREQAAAVNHLLRGAVLGEGFTSVERYPYMPFSAWVAAVADHGERSPQRRTVAQRGQAAAAAAAAAAAEEKERDRPHKQQNGSSGGNLLILEESPDRQQGQPAAQHRLTAVAGGQAGDVELGMLQEAEGGRGVGRRVGW